MNSQTHGFANFLKKTFYGSRGEPYKIADQTLRFSIGTRPVRTKYCTSANAVNRYDALQIIKFTELVKPGSLCLDIGGHSGECAIIMAALAGKSGSVISFEPDPDARRILDLNISLNKNIARIQVEPLAISDHTGTASFYCLSGNSNSSLAAVGSVKDARAFEVETQSLDEYINTRKLPMPSVVKIDIEGAEIHALRGAKQLLRSKAHLLVELHPYAWESFGVQFSEFLELVEKSGREAIYLDQTNSVINNPHYGTVILHKK